MFLDPKLKPPPNPQLKYADLSIDSDRSTALSVMQHLSDIGRWSATFSESRALIDLSRQQIADHSSETEGLRVADLLWFKWVSLGARSAVLAARNFGKALSMIGKNAGAIKPWASEIDFLEIRAASKRFSDAFPRVDAARHSVAHPEFYSDPSKNMSASNVNIGNFLVSSGDAVITLQDTLFDNTFTCTFEGSVITCDTSAESAALLVDVTRQIFHSFNSVSSNPLSDS